MKSAIRDRIDNADAASQPGPKTPEAKAIVRWNSYRHGLTGQILRTSADEQPFFERIADGFHQRFQPADEFEAQLVQRLVDDNWRLNTCAALENALFTHGEICRRHPGSALDEAVQHLITRALTWQEQGNSFERLGRYETHIHRRFHRNLKALEDAQFARNELKNAAAETTQPTESKSLNAEIDLFRKIVMKAKAHAANAPG